jgi:hypothetical protein
MLLELQGTVRQVAGAIAFDSASRPGNEAGCNPEQLIVFFDRGMIEDRSGHSETFGLARRSIESGNPVTRSILKHSKGKQADLPIQPGSEPANRPVVGHPGDLLRLKHARNRAMTLKNSAKVEHYLMQVERSHGFAKSWAFRERLELGHVSLEELMRR